MNIDQTPGLPEKRTFLKTLKKSILNFTAMAPLILGTVGIVGIFQTLVSPQTMGSFFRGNIFIDTLIGILAGAIPSGSPIISYLIGGELLNQGISLYPVTAFILSWVTLRLVHLPAEAEVFGKRFTLYRNLLAIVFTMIITLLTVSTLNVLP